MSDYVCLDAGHGGRDPGAVANDLTEKEINLELASLMRDRIEAGGVRVCTTRSDDRAVTLQARVRAAAGARALISIHHNASGNAGARGVEIFRSVNPSFLEASQELADSLYRHYRAAIPELPSRGVRTRTRTSDGRDLFHVLRESPVPAVLFEGAFLTNADDAALLRSEGFRLRQAQGLASGLLAWLGLEAISLETWRSRALAAEDKLRRIAGILGEKA